MTGGLNLVVGTDLDTDGQAVLNGEKFNRHTFWCGQSGSGKTYALGVVLERLLLRTGLPILVFDPNSDFVRLNEVRSRVDTSDEQALRRLDVRILRPRAEDPATRLVVRLIDMPL